MLYTAFEMQKAWLAGMGLSSSSPMKPGDGRRSSFSGVPVASVISDSALATAS